MRALGSFSDLVPYLTTFTLALKQEGRFVVLGRRLTTSGRRFRKNSGLQLLLGGIRLMFNPLKMFTQRAAVEKVWYGSDRSDDSRRSNSISGRMGSAIVLLVLGALATGPLWHLVPWSPTPLASPLGKLRLGIAVLLCHAGLLPWPVAILLLVDLLRQKRWTGVPQSAMLVAFFGWQACESTSGVVWVWGRLCRWLT